MSNYLISKKLFSEQTHALGAKIYTLPLRDTGVTGEALSIDIAWIGSPDAQTAILHIVGTHGIEGYAGNFVQNKIFSELQGFVIPNNTALIFVHLLNPWGYSYLRRTNSDNIDLNRNFLLQPEQFAGAPVLYSALNDLINPKQLPLLDFFYTKVALMILKYGYNNLKQALAGGQYQFPEGIFFGGEKISDEARHFVAWCKQNITSVKKLITIDIHSGLGAFGEESLLFSGELSNEKISEARRVFGSRVRHSKPEQSLAYRTSGGLVEILPELLPAVESTNFVQEFGTYSPLQVLKALRHENWWQLHGSTISRKPLLEHLAKKNLLEVFCPQNLLWQKTIAEKGSALLFKSIKILGNA